MSSAGRAGRITEVAWEQAGMNRGLDFKGGGRVDTGAHEDENRRHDNFIRAHYTFK